VPTVTTVRTDDGRGLEVAVGGPDDGDVLVFHHGTPGAALFPPGLVEAAARHGLRTAVVSRPGYGASSPQPGRTVADAAVDTAAVLDALGVDRFITLGWSGGGPHCLACAAVLPGRCEAAGVVAGVAPYEAFGDAWAAGMGEDNVVEFTAAAAGREPLEALLAGFDRTDATKDSVLAQISTLFSPIDLEAFRGAMGDYHVAGSQHGMKFGTDGWRDDDLAFVQPWGFDVGSIDVPLVMWQGREDRMVPFAHGEWLAASLPGVRTHLTEDEGHFSLMTKPQALVDEVVSLRRG
jgi:pimeloyl-ACP methyl ester carboxylesterase